MALLENESFGSRILSASYFDFMFKLSPGSTLSEINLAKCIIFVSVMEPSRVPRYKSFEPLTRQGARTGGVAFICF